MEQQSCRFIFGRIDLGSADAEMNPSSIASLHFSIVNTWILTLEK